MYAIFLRPILFLLSPEKAHHFTLLLLKITLKIPIISSLFKNYYQIKNKKLERELWGINFPNPVGLAAGFDKDGKHFEAMSSLGFGFIEIGTVTPIAQEGNPQPRLFRLADDQALINRMGFNNEGLEAMKNRIANRKNKNIIIGANIGKNKVTPNANAKDDYEKCFEALFDLVDYFVVNISSPNTPGLRELQDKKPLSELLTHLQTLNQEKPKPKPILLKIAPDLTDTQLDDIIEIVQATKLDGIIATNTTIDRSNLNTKKEKIEKIGNGGLSGQPLKQRSTEVIRYINKKTQGQIVIIGVGGIYNPQDAIEKINAGATLVQLYSGLIYKGPQLIKKINRSLLSK